MGNNSTVNNEEQSFLHETFNISIPTLEGKEAIEY